MKRYTTFAPLLCLVVLILWPILTQAQALQSDNTGPTDVVDGTVSSVGDGSNDVVIETSGATAEVTGAVQVGLASIPGVEQALVEVLAINLPGIEQTALVEAHTTLVTQLRTLFPGGNAINLSALNATVDAAIQLRTALLAYLADLRGRLDQLPPENATQILDGIEAMVNQLESLSSALNTIADTYD